MGELICALVFGIALWSGRRSIGLGLCVVLTIGYGYGLLRAYLVDRATYFAFDAAVLGFYLGVLTSHDSIVPAARGRAVLLWSVLLVGWPTLLVLLPDSSLLVRLVGLRASVLLIPMVTIGARAAPSDLGRVGRWLVALNLAACAVAAFEYVVGIEAIVPVVPVTELIYRSYDIAADGQLFHRIPSTFSSAHAFGGTMLASIPFLLAALTFAGGRASRGGLVLGGAAFVATVIGVFLSGARMPAVMLGIVIVISAVRGGLPSRMRRPLILAAAIVAAVVAGSGRLQRFTQLSAPDMIETRIGQSVNESFFELLRQHPFGAGLGSAAGTSLPAFVADEAPEQIGLESEYSRLLIELGLVGLVLWLAFVAWISLKSVHPPSPSWRPTFVVMQVFCLVAWVTALLGTGMLTSVPQSALVLFQMGVVGGGLWNDGLEEGVAAVDEATETLVGDGFDRTSGGAAS